MNLVQLRRSISPWIVFGMVCLLTVSGCEAGKVAKKVMKVIKEPDIEVGEPKDQPSKFDITVFLEPGANRNDFGEDVPTDIWIFQLGDDGRFLQSDFYEVTTDPEEALATTFVSLKEIQVKPSASKVIRDVEIDKETNYIGIAGGYLKSETVNWRSVMKVKPLGENYRILAVLTNRLVIMNVDR